jgi:hypothetical protein
MSLHIAVRLICLSCLGAALIGCESSEIADVAPVAESTDDMAANEIAVAEAQNESSIPATTVQFSPPFPDRTELFEPPKRASGSVRRDDEHGESVELKGFVNVDKPRAVLSIDGVISPIAEGGEKYGVQVISIQPPSVVLQRGRSRWTATLE